MRFSIVPRTFGMSLALLVILNACSTAAPTASPVSSTLANTSWLLSTINGQPVASGKYLDLLFGIRSASGFGGCNQFTTTYSSDGSTVLSFGDFATTSMACDATTSLLERTYLAALGQVARYVITGNSLSFAGSSGPTLLTYTAQAAPTVEGPWNVTMVNNGKGAVSSVPAGISAAMSFLPDSIVQGFAGCNDFSGGYTVTGQAITIGPLSATQKSCGDTVNAFEMQFLTALQNSTKWAVSSGTLDLRDANGALQVEATTAIGH